MAGKQLNTEALVQLATTADIREIVALIDGESQYLLPRSKQDVAESIHNFVVIKDKGQVVACASFENYAPKIAEIRSIVVDPSYRGKGYGEAMLAVLLKRVQPKQEVFVVTSKVPYFQKLGFDFTLNNEKQILFFQKGKKGK